MHTHVHTLSNVCCFTGPSAAPAGRRHPLPPSPAPSPGRSRSLPDVPAPSLRTTNRIPRWLCLCSGGGGGGCQKQQQELEHRRPATQGKKTRRTCPCPSAVFSVVSSADGLSSLTKTLSRVAEFVTARLTSPPRPPPLSLFPSCCVVFLGKEVKIAFALQVFTSGTTSRYYFTN